MIARFINLLILAAFFVSISSCDKTSCKKVTCGSGLECVTGKCVCADGTEGTGCTTASVTKYVRSWQVSESCSPIAQWSSTTNVFIQQNNATSAINRIDIYNLIGGQCTPITALIYTDASNQGNTLQIPTQSCSGNTLSGTGNYDPSSGRLYLQVDYTYQNGIDYQCNETLYPM